MIVKIEQKEKTVKLSNVKVGECFKMTGTVGGSPSRFMRISVKNTIHVSFPSAVSDDIERIVIVDLGTGLVTAPVSSLNVIKVAATVICDD